MCSSWKVHGAATYTDSTTAMSLEATAISRLVEGGWKAL